MIDEKWISLPDGLHRRVPRHPDAHIALNIAACEAQRWDYGHRMQEAFNASEQVKYLIGLSLGLATQRPSDQDEATYQAKAHNFVWWQEYEQRKLRELKIIQRAASYGY